MNGFWPRSAPEPGSSGLLVNSGVFFLLLLFFLLIQNLNCSDTLHHFQWIFNELLSSRSAVHAPDPSVLRLFLTLLLSWWRKCGSLRPKTSCNQSVCVRRELLLRSVTKPLTPDSLTSFIQTAPALTPAWEREQETFHRFVFVQFRGQDWGFPVGSQWGITSHRDVCWSTLYMLLKTRNNGTKTVKSKSYKGGLLIRTHTSLLLLLDFHPLPPEFLFSFLKSFLPHPTGEIRPI